MTDKTAPSRPSKVAIVGAGGIAETHAAILRKAPGVQLVAICDSLPGKAQDFAQRLGIPASYTDLRDMIDRAKPDVVHIATPPTVHAANAVDCLERDVHVFIEKPLATSTEECERIRKAAARSGRKVGVNHNIAFHPAMLRMIDKIREGRLGGLEHVAVCYNMPIPLSGPYSHWLFRDTANLMFELGPHPISAVERLMGPVVKCNTLASREMTLPSGVRFFPTWQLAFECERGTASLYLSIAGGFLDTWVRVEAEDGCAHADLRRNTMRLSEKSHLMRPNDDLRDGLSAARMLRAESFRNYRDYLLAALRRSSAYPASYAAMDNSIRAFHAAIATGATPPAGLAQGAAVVQACEAAVAPVAQMAFPTAV